MPSRGFHVLRASSAPFSTETSTTTSPVPPCRAATAATCARMNCRGIGLIAGSPTGSGRPGLVTVPRSEEHTSELQSRQYLVCRLLLEKKKKKIYSAIAFTKQSTIVPKINPIHFEPPLSTFPFPTSSSSHSITSTLHL